jgi:hypothetical protein
VPTDSTYNNTNPKTIKQTIICRVHFKPMLETKAESKQCILNLANTAEKKDEIELKIRLSKINWNPKFLNKAR